MTSFKDLHLDRPLLQALAKEGHELPTPIQSRAIPALLSGRDILACAQTGTGKTAAFALPTLQNLSRADRRGTNRRIRALILTPTRELAAQVGDRFAAYGQFVDLKCAVLYGGVNERPQIRALDRGVDIVVATPGRLIDLASRGYVDLSCVEVFILDEADRMLDMGFIRDIQRIMSKLPRQRQNMLFSATMPRSITTLARSFMTNPERVNVSPERPTVETVRQSLVRVEQSDKRSVLIDLLQSAEVGRAIVFTRTKHGANKLARQLEHANLNAEAIHGNKTQGARRRALEAFRSGKCTVLVATDIAARGIDVDDVTHVFNFDLPRDAESYIHRIGRTGRAGRAGVAVSLCSPGESESLRAIERLIGQRIGPKPTQNRPRRRRHPARAAA